MKEDLPGASGAAPLIVGIAGGSGSGKTFIAGELAKAVPEVVLLQHDSYYRHRPDLSFEQRSQVNYDHPDSLETDLLIHQLGVLAKGVAIDRPIYDFSAHLRATETDRIEPAPVIIVEGILVLTDSDLRDRLGLKIYVDTDPHIRLARRLSRDIDERGRTAESVLTQWFTFVQPMHNEFVEPSKSYADLVISEGHHPTAVATVIEMIRARLFGERPSIYSPTS